MMVEHPNTQITISDFSISYFRMKNQKKIYNLRLETNLLFHTQGTSSWHLPSKMESVWFLLFILSFSLSVLFFLFIYLFTFSLQSVTEYLRLTLVFT